VNRLHLQYGRPLLAASARLWAVALLACCAILVTVLGVLFAHHATADRLDRSIDTPIITWLAGHPGLAARLASPGSQLPAVVLSVAIVAACILTRRLNGAMLAAAAVPAAIGLNDGLCKPLVHRTYLGVLTYPSGHTATMFALAATVTILLLTPPQSAKTWALRALIPAGACVLGGMVAVGVIGLRWHYFTDTVAGAAVGIGTVCALAIILDLPAVRRRLTREGRQPPAAQERPSAAQVLRPDGYAGAVMRATIAYTSARILLLVVSLILLYLVGARGLLLLALAFVVSGIASFVLLSKQRDVMSGALMARIKNGRQRATGFRARIEEGARAEDEDL
jgi:membrane-associated phospholipid phosphatase